MTTEVVLLLVYSFLLIGLFIGDKGPIKTFKKATPRLAANIERDITVGRGFKQNKTWKEEK